MFYINSILLALSFIYLFKINKDNYYARIETKEVCNQLQQAHDIHESDYAVFDDENWIGIIAKKPNISKPSSNAEQQSRIITQGSQTITQEIHEKALKPIEEYQSSVVAKWTWCLFGMEDIKGVE